MRFSSFMLAATLLWSVLSGSAAAASGTAVGVDPSAEAQRRAGKTTLTVGADIFIGDRVVTGNGGQVQILFEDKTKLVVGPNSELVIEDYLLRDNGSAGKLAINALNGTFRFVTGSAAKDRYLVKTPTGTIGVRGTRYDFVVTKLLTAVLLYDGALRICNLAGTCVDLDDRCELGEYSLQETRLIGHTDGVKGADREALRAMFRYAVSQRPLLLPFRVEDAERCVNRPATEAGKEAEGSTGTGTPRPGRKPSVSP